MADSEIAAPPTKRQCTKNVAENPNSAWSQLIYLVRRDVEEEKNQLRVQMLLSLSMARDVNNDEIASDEMSNRLAAQHLVHEGKEKVFDSILLRFV